MVKQMPQNINDKAKLTSFESPESIPLSIF